MSLEVPANLDEYCALSHRELNREAEKTILLIHGAFGDGSSWDLVTQHLSPNYHLLLPDLPSHGIASHIAPFSIGASARLLSELIAQRAHNGVAKIVGHSLGADVALRLISEFPSVVDDAVFISGASTPSASPSQYMPYAAWFEQRIEWFIPRPLNRFLMDGADLPRPNLTNCTLELNRQIFASPDKRWPSPWPARTLIVAAGKGDIIPSRDNADTARRLAEIGREGNDATLAVVHPGMRHPWNYQAPALFAAAVDAWFRDGEAVDGFTALS